MTPLMTAAAATSETLWSSWITAGAAVVSAVAVVLTAFTAVRTLKAHRADSVATSRPMIAATLEPDPLDSNTQHFVIGNYGQGIARDVQVSFDPSPLVTDDGSEAAAMAGYVESRFAGGIATWVPGYKLRNVYMHWTKEADGNAFPLPDEFTVTVRYRSDTGHEYQDRFPLTIEHLSGQTISGNTTPGADAERKRAVEAIESIARGVGRL